MEDLKYLRASDGTGEAVLAHIETDRLPGGTTLNVDNVDNWPSDFIATIGTPDSNGYIDPDTMTQIRGHLDSGNIAIDGFEPGYTDNGNTTDQIVIIKQTTGWANRVRESLANFFQNAGQGWYPLGVVPTLAANNGNRSANISLVGDKTSVLSKGMRLKIPRTGTTPTQSAVFNGVNQFASRASANIAGMGNTSVLTTSAWVYLTEYPTTNSTISSRYLAATNAGFHFYIASNGTVILVGREATKTVDNISSGVSVPLNRWVHVAASIDVPNATGKIYFDGVEVVSSYTNGTSTTITAAGDLSVGNVIGSSYMKGRIAQYQQWYAILSQDQIRQYMYQELTGSESNLTGYFKLNGDWNDSSANNNHLTPSGSPSFSAGNPFNPTAYAIITTDPVYTLGNTTFTVQTPSGYSIPNATLGEAYYSSVKTPFGFPMDKSQWAIQNLTVDESVISGYAADTWRYVGRKIDLPAGEWDVSYQSTLYWTGASNSYNFLSATLSASQNAPTMPEFNVQTSSGNTAMTAWRDSVYSRNLVKIPALTPLYLLGRCNRAGSIGSTSEDDNVTAIMADFAYL